ncbi:MAG: hypothetical protein JWR03_2403 [Cohnella sp.]|nr:hypothetical protein [Cohnella sp.]
MSEQKAVVIFNKLIVIDVENSSGIFIGTNQAVGWSSYSKINQGFGSLQDATLTNSVNVVHDQDVMDASIHDARHITLSDGANNLQQCIVDFQSVNVNSVMNGSAIDLGDNKQLGWRSSRKVNYGGGKNLGANRMSHVVNFTLDNDVVDAPFHTEGQIIQSTSASVASDIRITQKRQDEDAVVPD